jgi:DNA invertase Pin-like site-specific DNA recombinase
MTALRMRAGKLRKRERGGYTGGAPPYGKRAQAGSPVVDELERKSLKRILDLRRGGASLRQIAAVLEEEGHAPKRGARWHPEVIRAILHRLSERVA